MNPIVPQPGYRQWIAEPSRQRSPEVDFGVHWHLNQYRAAFGLGPTWRVSWIEDTGELYATDTVERFIVLGVFPNRKRVEQVMRGWADPDSPIYRNLDALARRLGKVLMP